MNGVYKTTIYGLHLSLWVKTNGPSVTAIVLFCFRAAPLRKIAQLQSPLAHSFNQSLSWPYIMKLSICTTDESRTVELTLWVVCAWVNFVIRRSSRFYNTQRIWQPLWWRRNVWCFTVAEAVRRANRKLPIIQILTAHEGNGGKLLSPRWNSTLVYYSPRPVGPRGIVYQVEFYRR